MNVGVILALIVALALAATGNSTTDQANVSNRSTAVRGHNLNHNETLVRDIEFKTVGPTGCPKWLCGGNHNKTLVRDNEFKGIGPVSCPKWICGSNHNETLMRHAGVTRQPTRLRSRASSFRCRVTNSKRARSH